MKNKFLFLILFLVPLAQAQTEEKKVYEPEPKIKTGIMATSGVRVGGGSKGVVDVNTIDSSPGDSMVAVSGGVSNSGGDCSANLTNASKTQVYRVRFEVVGLNQRGTQLFKKPFSGSIPPSGKLTKNFDCKPDAELQLNLKSVEPVK